MDETRTQKLWRIFKGWLASGKAVINGMSTEERQVFAIVAMVVAVIAIAATLVVA